MTTTSSNAVMDKPQHNHNNGITSSTGTDMLSSSSSPLAHEVLGLLGYVLGMWSRHKESLQMLACGGDMKEEEVAVMVHLSSELRDMCETVVMNVQQPQEEKGASSSSSSESSSMDYEEEDDDEKNMLTISSEVSGDE